MSQELLRNQASMSQELLGNQASMSQELKTTGGPNHERMFGWFHPNCSLRSDIKSLVTIRKKGGRILQVRGVHLFEEFTDTHSSACVTLVNLN